METQYVTCREGHQKLSLGTYHFSDLDKNLQILIKLDASINHYYNFLCLLNIKILQKNVYCNVAYIILYSRTLST